MMLMMFCLPKMMENVDPEELKQMQDKMKSSGEDPMDQLPGREQRGSVRIIKKYTRYERRKKEREGVCSVALIIRSRIKLSKL